MHKINLSDNYSVMIEKPLCDYDRRTLNALYLPIVGIKAINLFYSFHDSIISSEHESHVTTFATLARFQELNTDYLEDSINKLEAVGLVDTYFSNGLYVFYVNDVPTPSAFFKDELLYQALISSVTKEEAEKIALEMLVRRVDLKGFENISKRFDEVFLIEEEINHFNTDALIVENESGVKVKNENFNYRHFTIFTSALGILSEEDLNSSELEDFVNRYSFLYNLTEEEMKEAFACSMTTQCKIDYELVKKNIKRIYNNKNKKSVKVTLRKTETADERVSYLESTTPEEIVKHKYNEPMVASEIATMDELLKSTGIGLGFLNTVLIYVLEERNGDIPTYNYFNKIIQTWKRAGVKTTIDALNYLDNLSNPSKKTYSKAKVKKSVPDWYSDYQEENKKNLSSNIKTKEENIEDLEEFFKVKES